MVLRPLRMPKYEEMAILKPFPLGNAEFSVHRTNSQSLTIRLPRSSVMYLLLQGEYPQFLHQEVFETRRV